jgi:prolipoprotein diacylglyceryl transferase
VIAGIVGARIYHLITSWNQDSAIHAHWYGPFAVWSGGLGIWGAIPFGLLVGGWVVHRSGNPVRLMMDAAAPGLLLAQGIGRWGNYFNQELYGKHTTLPWALEIHGKGAAHLYHPTFLYEFVWDLLGVVALLWIDRRFTIKRPGLFALYVAIYCAFRTYEETLRIDPSNHFLGQRVNFWVSLVCFIGSVSFFVWWQFFHKTSSESSASRPRPIPTGPKMAVPKGRVR